MCNIIPINTLLILEIGGEKVKQVTKENFFLYGHDFEGIVGEKDIFTGLYRAILNYSNYPEPFSEGIGESKEEAINNAARKALASNSLEAVKRLYD